jgi:hypothetical protein
MNSKILPYTFEEVRIMSKAPERVTDEQTGQSYEINPESKLDVVSAWISGAYSLGSIAFLAWLLLDIWSGEYSFSFLKPYKAMLVPVEGGSAPLLDPKVFKLVAYTAIGGGMGAAVNNIRGFIQWHAERKAFGWRFIWKYLALPPIGATLAVLVYGIIQGGIAVFNGGTIATSGITAFSAWATGTLAGYGSHKVFIWLDDKVNSLFKVEAKQVTVPDVSGKSLDDAKKVLINSKLAVGDTTDAETRNTQQIGKVIGQSPAAGTEIACDSKVSIVVGAAADGEGADEDKSSATDLTGKAAGELEKILPNGKLDARDEKSKAETVDLQELSKDS